MGIHYGRPEDHRYRSEVEFGERVFTTAQFIRAVKAVFYSITLRVYFTNTLSIGTLVGGRRAAF